MTFKTPYNTVNVYNVNISYMVNEIFAIQIDYFVKLIVLVEGETKRPKAEFLEGLAREVCNPLPH